MSLFSGEDGEEGKRRSLGSGVILLAQQLMGGAKEENNRYESVVFMSIDQSSFQFTYVIYSNKEFCLSQTQ